MSRKKKKPEPEIVEATEEDLERIDEKGTDWQDKYLRTLAELDNFRKRTERESDQRRRYALEGFLRELLPAVDALQHATEAPGEEEAIREGVRLALAGIRALLVRHGVEPIEAVGVPFDPRFHEAVGMEPAEDALPGTVLREERTGYVLHDRVLRPSRVHIALPRPAAEADKDE